MTAITSRRIAEAVGIKAGAVSADGSGGITTNYMDMTNARKGLVFAQVSTGAVDTIQLREATDDEGTDAQDLGDAVTIGESEGYLEIDAVELSDGFTHLAAVVTADGANPTSATLVEGDRRFNP